MTKRIAILVDNYCQRFKKPFPVGSRLFYQILQEAVDISSVTTKVFDPEKEFDLTAISPSDARGFIRGYFGQYFSDPHSLDTHEDGNYHRTLFLNRLLRLVKKGDITPLRHTVFDALHVLKIARIEDLIEELDRKVDDAQANEESWKRFLSEAKEYTMSPYPEVEQHFYDTIRRFGALINKTE